MRNAVSLSCALALGLASLCSRSASAQSAQTQVSVASQPSEANSAATLEESALEEPAKEDDESEDPMGWIGIGVKVGLANVGRSAISVDAASLGLAQTVNGTTVNPEHTFTTPRRTGLQVAIPINLGGDGFGWVVEPYFHFADYRATGVYTGPTINLHLADPLYFGFGFGFKGAILKADSLDYGIDLGGRVPFTLHYYVGDDLALVGEFAIGYTATGLTLKPAPGATGANLDDVSFGGAFSWDFGFGVRFP